MSSKATIMLVHGDMAESASWDGVIPKLLAQGYSVVVGRKRGENSRPSIRGDSSWR
jgi:alpha-beta hydrolase superfamily lysophospholipase